MYTFHPSCPMGNKYTGTPPPLSPLESPLQPPPPHCPKQKANSSLFTSIGYTYWQFEFCIHSMTCMQLATLVLFYKGDNL